jgi:Lrp/AsnC family transcriptional regulator for asnA, asnC and gidA
MESLDKIDKKILYLLDLNSRQSLSQIGKKAGLSKANVRYRINRLQHKGIIKKFYTVIDTFKLGYTSLRIYLILENVNPEIEEEIIQHFVNNKYTWWVGKTVGRFDIVIILWIKNINEFYKFWESTLMKYRSYFSKQVFSPFAQLLHYRYSFLLEDNNIEDRNKYEITGSQNIVEYDQLDFRILKILATNSRASLTDMMKILQVSTKTIRKKIRRMKELGIIQGFRIQIDYLKIGYQYYKVDIDLINYKKNLSMIKYIKKNPNLIFIDKSAGFADLELEFYVKNLDQLLKIIYNLIKQFPGVIKSYKYFYLKKIFKIQYLPE